MARGGARAGAGRKQGSATRKTRAVADKAAKEGRTPLEVILRAMEEHADAGRWDDAAERAKDAAPYVHPRLTSVAVSGALEHTHYVARLPMPCATLGDWEAQYRHLRDKVG